MYYSFNSHEDLESNQVAKNLTKPNLHKYNIQGYANDYLK